MQASAVRARIAVLAVTAAATAAVVPTANAALGVPLPAPLNTGPTKPGPVTPAATPVDLTMQLLGGAGSLATNQIGLFTFAEIAACPGVKTLGDLAPPNTPGMTEAQFAACVMHFLDFEWRTTYPGQAPGVTDDRMVTTLGVPTPLNLDADLVPEALAYLTVLAPNQFQLGFRRIDGGTDGDLPSTAELVITDPTGGNLPKPFMGVGLSSITSGDRFPDQLNVTFTLESMSPAANFPAGGPSLMNGPPRFRVDIDSIPQAKRAVITADLFDEDEHGTVRDSFVRGEVGMRPVPARLTTKVATRTDNGIDVDLTTSNQNSIDVPPLTRINYTVGSGTGKPTIDALVRIRQPLQTNGDRRVQLITAKLTDLPSYTGLRYRPLEPTTPAPGASREEIDQARGGQTMDYAASSALTSIEANYDDVVQPASGPDVPSLRAHLLAGPLPTGMGFAQRGSFTNFDANDAGIGKIEAEFALNGDLVQRRTARPGVRFVRPEVPSGDPQPLQIAARIDGLRRVAFDNLEGRMVADVGIVEQPFDIDLRDEVTGLTATAAIENLPADALFQMLPGQPAAGDPVVGDPEPMRVRYDAGTHTIENITFKVGFDDTIAGLLDEIEGHIHDLPPVIDVTSELVGGVYSFRSNQPFGEIQALARNREAIDDEVVPPLTAGVTGASVIWRDAGTFAALARVQGLEAVDIDTALNKYHVEAGAVPLEVRADVDEVRGSEVLPRLMLGTIDLLPDRIDLQFDELGDEKVISYDASAGIGELALDLTGPKLYAPQEKINHVRAVISDIPSQFTATLGSAGKLDFDAGPIGIGKIEGLITSGPDPAFPGTEHQAYLELGDDIVIKALLLGFKRFKMDKEPLDVTFETAHAKPLQVDAKLDLVDDDGDPETEAHLRIEDVPALMHVTYDGVRELHYDASQEIDSINASARFFQNVGGDDLQRDATATLLGIPDEIDLDYGTDATGTEVTYDASSEIDSISLGLTGEKLVSSEERIEKVRATVEGIPAHLGARIDNDGSIDLDGGSGIDKIEALVSDGSDPALPVGKHAAIVQANGTGFAAKAQLLGFKGFTLDPQPLAAELETAASFPLEVDANVDEVRGVETLNRVAALDISAVPSTVSVEIQEPTAGTKKIVYDASAEIDSIDLTVNGPKLYAPKPQINRLEAHIEGIPATLSATLGSTGKIDLDASPGIDSIEALVTSGPDPAFTAGSHGAYVETGNNLVAKARLLGFKRFILDPDPLDVTFETDTDYPLEADAKIDWDDNGTPETIGTLDIRNVPSTMRFQAESDASYTYTASSRIDSIDLNVKGFPDVPDQPAAISEADVQIDGVPRVIAAGFGDNGRVLFRGENGSGGLSAVDAIQVSAKTASPPALPSGLAASHAAYRHIGNQAHAQVKVSGLREIDIKPAPLDVVVDTDVLAALDVDAKVDVDNAGGFEKTLLAEVRSNIRRVTVKDELAAAGRKLTVDTGTELGSIHAELKADNLPMGIQTATLDLEDIPEIIQVGFPAGTDVIDIDLLRRVGPSIVTDSRGLGLLDLSVNNGQPRRTIVNRHGATVASDGLMADIDGGNITSAALELRGLRGVTFGTSPYTKVGIDVEQSQAQPLALDVTLDDKFANGHLDKIPANTLVELSPVSDTPIRYSADNRISEIEIDTNFTKAGAIKGAQVQVQDVPTQFAVCFKDDGSRASCVRPGNPFDGDAEKKISVAYTSDVTTTGTRPAIFVKACFNSETCSSGKIATIDVDVSRRIELEAGAGANGPTVRGFTCFDDVGIDEIFDAIGCAFAYPVHVVSDALNSARAGAFVFFDTGSQNFNGTVTYTLIPAGGVVTEAVTLILSLPTLNATDAYLDAELSLKQIVDGAVFTHGGSMTCSGGYLGITARFGASLGSIDIPNWIHDLIDAYNALPGDDISISDPLSLGAIDVPVNWNLIPRFC